MGGAPGFVGGVMTAVFVRTLWKYEVARVPVSRLEAGSLPGPSASWRPPRALPLHDGGDPGLIRGKADPASTESRNSRSISARRRSRGMTV